MNITYLIGNGFDLNIGLKTKYSDFYSYFINDKSNDNNLIKKWLNEDLGTENEILWSDLEKRLGELTSRIGNESEAKSFNDGISNMVACLNTYLSSENNRISISEKQELIKQELVKSLKSFITNGSHSDNSKINSLISRISNKDFTYNFLVFNYTDILDRILSLYENNKIIGNHQYSNGTYKDIIGTILHVHGSLDRGMILGVNDKSQISGDVLKKNQIYLDCLIKDKLNQNLGDGNIELASELINNSSVIVTYGLSIGLTDKNWWYKLIKWVSSSDSHYLIINSFDNNFSEKISQNFVIKHNQIINDLKNVAGITDFNGHESRILFYINKKAFNFSFLVKDIKG